MGTDLVVETLMFLNAVDSQKGVVIAGDSKNIYIISVERKLNSIVVVICKVGAEIVLK